MSYFTRAAVAATLLASFTFAQRATVSVLHGVPGLSQAVEVFANKNRLFSFDYGELKGPLELQPGRYDIEVKLRGQTILQQSAVLEGNANYSIVAHLKETSGSKLSVFVNDLGRTREIGRFFATTAFRHVAAAPAVDVYAQAFQRDVFVYGNVANGQEGKDRQDAPAYLGSVPTSLRLTPAGQKQTAFGPQSIGNLASGKFYSVFAIGELGKTSFRFVVQSIDGLELQARVSGKACGGKISLSTTDVRFGQPFDVRLTGATRNVPALLHIGDSDRSLANTRLPLDLSPIGASGCFLYQNLLVAIPVRVDTTGNARVPFLLPQTLSPSFQQAHFQYSFLGPGSNALNFLLTDYASVEKAN